MGLRNLLLITGDPGRVGDYPDATAVFDVDSIGLTNVVSRLNQGCDVGGQAIGAPTAFHIGVSVNPAASNLDEELRRFDYKVEAGAEFVLTRPIFDVCELRTLPEAHRAARLPVVAGIFPFESVRNAEFMANEVPGVTRARGADGADAARRRPRRRGGRGHRDRAGDRPASARNCAGHPGVDRVGKHRRGAGGRLMDFADGPDV